MSIFDLQSKVTLVTGGCRGIGLHAAKGFIEAGASKVYITARDEKTLIEAVEELNTLAKSSGKPGVAQYIVADLSTSEGVKALVAELSAKEQKLDILFANAGIASQIEPTADDLDSKFDQMYSVNVRSVYQLVLLLKPLLQAAASPEQTASVIITGSGAGTITSGLNLEIFPYAASKAAVHHLTQLLAKLLASDFIRVNALACGVFPTRMSSDFIEHFGHETVLGLTPLSRLGLEDDIKGATLFLSSKAGSYVTGAVLPLDGGFHL